MWKNVMLVALESQDRLIQADGDTLTMVDDYWKYAQICRIKSSHCTTLN